MASAAYATATSGNVSMSATPYASNAWPTSYAGAAGGMTSTGFTSGGGLSMTSDLTGALSTTYLGGGGVSGVTTGSASEAYLAATTGTATGAYLGGGGVSSYAGNSTATPVIATAGKATTALTSGATSVSGITYLGGDFMLTRTEGKLEEVANMYGMGLRVLCRDAPEGDEKSGEDEKPEEDDKDGED